MDLVLIHGHLSGLEKAVALALGFEFAYGMA